MAFTALFGLIASILIQELDQCLIARKYGTPIDTLTLHVFGGVAKDGSDPRSVLSETMIALAGPITGLALAVVFWSAMFLTRQINAPAPVPDVLAFLGLANLVLASINLVPALPLDGGRILRAVLWRRHGNILAATTAAAKLGAVIGYSLMGSGVIALFLGIMTAGIWGIVLGYLIVNAARASYHQQFAASLFGQPKVLDRMQHDPIVAGPDMTLADFVNRIVLGQGVSFVPVVEDGVLMGHMDQRVLADIDRENWASTRIGDVFAGLNTGAVIPPDLTIQALLDLITNTGRRKFLVVEGSDLVGIISLADLTRFVQPGPSPYPVTDGDGAGRIKSP